MKPVEEIILPESELEIMTAVWNAEEALHRPVYSREINNYGSDYVKGIQTTTMITFLGRLVYKHFLEDKKNGRKIYFTSLVKRDDYLPRALHTFISGVFSGDRVELAKLLVADMSKDELAATHDIL